MSGFIPTAIGRLLGAALLGCGAWLMFYVGDAAGWTAAGVFSAAVLSLLIGFVFLFTEVE